MRLGAGLRVISSVKGRPKPLKPIVLYEFEACPFCRKVRDTLTMLDLDVIVKPCPKGGTRFREEVKVLGGKLQFPFLVDENTGKKMYESQDIIQYLCDTYAGGAKPWITWIPAFDTLLSASAGLFRPSLGGRARPSKPPEKLLELWSMEASPYCRIVRETLCELELPYVLHNVAKGSQGRPAFVARSKRQMVPYLADPNTGREMFESADIKAYLLATYAKP